MVKCIRARTVANNNPGESKVCPGRVGGYEQDEGGFGWALE